MNLIHLHILYLSNAYLIFNRLMSDKKNLDGFVKPASEFLKIQKLFTTHWDEDPEFI